MIPTALCATFKKELHTQWIPSLAILKVNLINCPLYNASSTSRLHIFLKIISLCCFGEKPYSMAFCSSQANQHLFLAISSVHRASLSLPLTCADSNLLCCLDYLPVVFKAPINSPLCTESFLNFPHLECTHILSSIKSSPSTYEWLQVQRKLNFCMKHY